MDINEEIDQSQIKKKQTDISFEISQRQQSIHQNIKPYQTSKPRITKTVLNAVSAGVSNAIQGAISQASINNNKIDFSSPLDRKNSQYINQKLDQMSVGSTSPFRSSKNYPSLAMLHSGRRQSKEQMNKMKETILNTTSKCIKQQQQQQQLQYQENLRGNVNQKNLMLNLDNRQIPQQQPALAPNIPNSNLNVYIGSLNVSINLHLDSSSIDKQQKQRRQQKQNINNRTVNNVLQDCKQGLYEKSYPASAMTTNRQTGQKHKQDFISLKQFGQLIQSSRKRIGSDQDQNQNVSDVAEEAPIMRDQSIFLQTPPNDQNLISPIFQKRNQPMFSIDTVPIQQFLSQNHTNSKVPHQNKQPTPAKPSFIAAVNLTDKKSGPPPKSFIHNRFHSTNNPFQSMINNNNNIFKKASIYQSQLGVKPPFYNLGGSHNQSYSGCGGSSSNRKQAVIKQTFQQAIQQYSLKKNKYYHSYLIIMKQDNPQNQNIGNQISDSQSKRYQKLYQLHQKAQIFQDKDAIAILLQILRDLLPSDKIRLEVSHLISILPEKQLRMCYDQIEKSQNQLKKRMQQQQSDIEEDISDKILELNTQDSKEANQKLKNLAAANILTQENKVIEFQRGNYQELKMRSRQANRNRLRTLGDNQLGSVTTLNYGVNISNTQRSKILQRCQVNQLDESSKMFLQKPTPLNRKQLFQFQNSMTNIQRYLDEKNKIRLRVQHQNKQKSMYQSVQRKSMILHNLPNQKTTSKSAFKTLKNNNNQFINKVKAKQQMQNRITIGGINNKNTINIHKTMMSNYNQKYDISKSPPIKPVKIIKKQSAQVSDNDVSPSKSGGRFTVRHMSNYFGNAN